MGEVNFPEEWLLTKFTEVLDIQGGAQPPKSQFIGEPQEGYIRLLQIRDFGAKPVPTYIPETSKLKKCYKNDLLIGRYGASLGRICSGMEGAYNVALAKVISGDSLNKQFLKSYLESEMFQQPLTLLSRSAQNGFNKEDLATFDFALPPLAEQKVIADQLDNLFVQVETIKANLEHIPNILKRFRQSVLAAAVSGKLTNSNCKIWQQEKLMKLTTKIGSGATPKGGDSTYKKSGIPLVRSLNIYTNFIKYENLAFIDEEQANKLANVEIEEDDILLNITGASIGRVNLAPKDFIGGRVNQHVTIIRCINEKLVPKYLHIYLASPYIQEWIKKENYGATRQALTKGMIEAIQIELPSLDEQNNIVHRVEKLFTFANNIEQKTNAALDHINNLTPSILTKAFNGELTADWRSTNHDLICGENSAEALLKKIKTERKALKKPPKPVQITAKKKTGERMSKQPIKVVEALKQAGRPLSGQQLLGAAGYPSDSGIEQLEQFFLDIRDSLTVESIVKLKRSDDGQDWFALVKASSNE